MTEKVGLGNEQFAGRKEMGRTKTPTGSGKD